MKKALILFAFFAVLSCQQEETDPAAVKTGSVIEGPAGDVQFPTDLQSTDNGRAQTCTGAGEYNWTWYRNWINSPTVKPSEYSFTAYVASGPNNGCSGITGASIVQPNGSVGYNGNILFTLKNWNDLGTNYAAFNYEIYIGRSLNKQTGILYPGQTVSVAAMIPYGSDITKMKATVYYKLTPVCPSNLSMNHRMTFTIVNCQTPQIYPTGAPAPDPAYPHNFIGANLSFTCP